jgi:hypothetical protein
MSNLKPNVSYVYESPDGGDTVYAREAGKTERIMIGQNTRAKSLVEKIQEDKLWGEIRRMATTDPAMAELLDRVKVYYQLKKNTP